MWMQKEPLLGIFDSGVGGFSVYAKIRESSQVDVVYYGDCLRAPYGNREESEILEFIKEDIRFLQNKGVTYFVNACNSMSVITTDLLLKSCKVSPSRYTDMIRAFDIHSSFSEGDRVLVMATQATIRSGVYQKVLQQKNVEVFEYPFKDLAHAIENSLSKEDMLSIIEKGMQYAKAIEATHIIYGCTHYPLIHDLFLYAGDSVKWKGLFIDPAVYVVKEIEQWNIKGSKKFYPHSSKNTKAFINSIISLL
jgi:glutamate racemase